MRARVHVLGLLVVLAATALGGCASAGGGASRGGDPAAVVPAGAALYSEAAVRVDGAHGAAAEAVLARVLGTSDPGAKVRGLVDDAVRRYGITYADDVEPWLGDTVAAAITSPRSRDGDPILVLASADDARARAAVDKLRGAFSDRTYGGVSYRYEANDATAVAVVDHNVVVGTEAGVRAAIDAAGGKSLTAADGLREARAKLASDRVGLVYVDVPGALGAAAHGLAGHAQLAVVLPAIAAALPKTLAAAVQPDGDAIRLDAVALDTPAALAGGRSGADVVASLPRDAWLAVGVADLGRRLDGALQALSTGGLGGIGVQALLGELQQQTGLDLRRDVLSWMGDAGLFVAGGAGDLRGGLVVRTSDPAATRRAIDGLEGFAAKQRGAHVAPLRAAGVDAGFGVRAAQRPPVAVALAGDRFVVAVGGRRALAAALDSSGPSLAGAPAFAQAAAKLGRPPSLFVDLGRLPRAHAGWLDAFDALAGAARDEGGGVVRGRFVVTLEP